jgi:hypothetical protein
MKSLATPRFWKLYSELGLVEQSCAKKAYALWLENPQHPSLHWKRIGKFWSVRINDDYRALAHVTGDTARWVWIGSHAEYERMLRG